LHQLVNLKGLASRMEKGEETEGENISIFTFCHQSLVISH
jgi:hypothetical protein